MTLFDYYARYMTELWEGKRPAPEGITLPEDGDEKARIQSLAQQLAAGELTRKTEPVVWRCVNCGYTYEANNALERCPVCGAPAGEGEAMVNPAFDTARYERMRRGGEP